MALKWPHPRFASNAFYRPLFLTTKNVLINWALSVVLNHVDMESTRLAECPTFVRKRNERISWDLLLSWWMNDSQEKIANIAPAVFAIASTCAVSKEDHEQLEEAEKNASNVLPSLPSSNDATPSNAAPTTTPAFDIVSSGVPMTMRSDLWLGVTVAILALLHLRYTYAIIFPTLVSIFLFTRIDVSVAYSTILSGLHVLASGAGTTQLRAFGATVGTAVPIFQIPFDNVSKTRPAWQQSLGRRDEVNSGTAATLVQLEDVLPGALEAEPLIE
ncbi:hypothetical protein EV421DRAFT_1735827 [Armillaria borealis]|uniref:Uncharacterized protein n=1 Tax=Armillaria borealis TaxID=47425 RepID=A0AA39JMP4_9AGAR|nr:hypothetical protein EV421DRAFT_1735827 [Armillaria borealis]